VPNFFKMFIVMSTSFAAASAAMVEALPEITWIRIYSLVKLFDEDCSFTFIQSMATDRQPIFRAAILYTAILAQNIL